MRNDTATGEGDPRSARAQVFDPEMIADELILASLDMDKISELAGSVYEVAREDPGLVSDVISHLVERYTGLRLALATKYPDPPGGVYAQATRAHLRRMNGADDV